MDSEPVQLTQEKETLLVTLYSRAHDSLQPDPVLGDKTAEELVRRLDYDFQKLEISTGDRYAVVLRAKQLDSWTEAFLVRHAARPVTVLHLACGLDSRVIRIAPSPLVRWYDVDFPEVIELRRRLYPEQPGHQLIAASVSDPSWLEELPPNDPVLVIAEGLTMYLAEADLKQLFSRITNHFATGELIFDVINRLAVRTTKNRGFIRNTGASLRWGIDDPRELEKWSPRLRLAAELPLMNLPEVARMPWLGRQLCGWMSRIPPLRNMIRLLRFQF